MGIGVLGGIVGGSVALAKNLKARKDGEDISNSDIAKDTAKEAAGAGAATVFSAYVVGIVGGGQRQSVGVTADAVLFGLFHPSSVGSGYGHHAEGAPRAAFDNCRLLRQQLEGAAAYGAKLGDADFQRRAQFDAARLEPLPESAWV